MATDLQVEERTFFRRLDWNLLAVIFCINVIGLITLYSATHGASAAFSQTRLFWLQTVYLVMGWIVFFGVTLVDYQFFNRAAYILYAINLIALALVLVIGRSELGARRWLELGLFRYQPSETMKLVLVFILAKILSKQNKPEGMGFLDLIIPTLITIVPTALTVKQPDLGTGLMLFAVFVSMVLFVRVRTSVLISVLIVGMVTVPLVWTFGLKPYQKARIATFISPDKHPHGAGYNSLQSLIAVGSGEIIGKGFRKGTQSQLDFLPERHTDFIFSVLSEEHGFIGGMTTVGLFIFLLFMCAKIAAQAHDRFGVLVGVGAVSILFWHVIVNICMVIGLLPVVGVPLPLISYGGSMMITAMASLGIISSLAYRKFLF